MITMLDRLLQEYAEAHTTRGNRITHFIGVPIIMFGLFSMLGALVLVPTDTFVVTGAEALIVVAVGFYLVLDWRLALAMLVIASALDIPARLIADWRVGLVAFVVGWLLQAIGHARYEKRSPAFLRNLVQLLIGPLFLINEVLHLRTPRM